MGTVSESVSKWYVLNVQRGKELYIKEWLENNKERYNVDKKLTRVVVPQDCFFKLRRGKNVLVSKVRFPGYIFIEADIENGEVEEFLRISPFFVTFIRSNDSTCSAFKPLPKEEVCKILQYESEMKSSSGESGGVFIIGEIVSIIDGPFCGFSGTIKSLNLKNNSAKISVNIFSREVEIELFLTQIKKK